ncbi:putative ribosome quality control (RQC) complex YloA/Tae2 family protein [Clostridium pascui]|uniref:Rqc2 family fibronectin-binding protein n=1 Tax=Clostridium pascui TaxID=46609 RepID=UPI00195B972D|nr:NFACT RNA binding domain-containing protein [Clostridium pascui]MBM7869346.1 putative ribosome quality control (RQC) complex YloA/Tae2 family protein [Clostridium pascui]
MALDGIFLYSLVQEFKDKIIGGKVEKINQPEKDELLLSIKKDRVIFKLLISASAVYPRIHFTDITKENPMSPPMFCMLLRKYLTSSRIVDVRQLESDRVLFLDFQSKDEFGFDSIYTLVIEIMGRHSNVTLVRAKDNMIMDSIKHVTPDINSIRCLYPGIKFVYPPSSEKLNPFNYTYEDLSKFVTESELKADKNFFSKVFTGVSTGFSKELHNRLALKNITLSLENLNVINDYICDVFNNLYNKNFYFATYSLENRLKDFHCIKSTYMNDYEYIEYNSPSKLLDKYYAEKDKEDRLSSRSSNLQKLVNTNLDRCLKKLDILKNNLKECAEKDTYRIFGELLTANIYNIKPGNETIEVLNYYSEDGEFVKIKLDPNKSSSQNIQMYFKKYNKLKKSEEAASIQIESTKEEIRYLQSVLTNILNIEDYNSIDEIKNELMETGYIKFKKDSKKKDKKSKPMHFISSDGIDIYVGKNNIQNDFLTLKFADKNDIWLHTKEIPGSHVIIKHKGNLPETTLDEAANLAAYYSKAKDSSKVAIDYTEARHVHKPNGAKPGMVIYYTNKTIYITPEKPNLKKLQ